MAIGFTAKEFASEMEAFGFSTKLRISEKEAAVIDSTYQGLKFVAILTDARQPGKFRECTFSTGFTDRPHPAKVNEFNKRTKWTKAYLDDKGTLEIEFYFSVFDVGPDYVREQFLAWTVALQNLGKYF